MSPLPAITEYIAPFLPLIQTSVIVGLLLWAAHLLIIKRYQSLGNERLFSRQLLMLALTFVGVVAIALALPVSESSRNQVITLIGLVISGIFAFSSSTIFSNIMAGTMLRVTKPFRTGDFIEVGDFFGRVVERGLLDTEIQTENRELVALPNTYLITHPISVTRSSGCIVSTTLSLGYDVHHSRVEALLLEAANASELDEPFIQVLELGDYSITYKVSGMLGDVKSLLTARSNLRRNVLDSLHGGDIEIVSPAFMNQRRLADDARMIPARAQRAVQDSGAAVEDVVFDKAEKAEQYEKSKHALIDKINACTTAIASAADDERERLKQLMQDYQVQLDTLRSERNERTADDQPNAAAQEAKNSNPAAH